MIGPGVYWYRTCTSCGQGRLYLQRDITHDRLYLHCEECEWGWLDPEACDRGEPGFLTLLLEYESDNPSESEIEVAGWRRFAKHRMT